MPGNKPRPKPVIPEKPGSFFPSRKIFICRLFSMPIRAAPAMPNTARNVFPIYRLRIPSFVSFCLRFLYFRRFLCFAAFCFFRFLLFLHFLFFQVPAIFALSAFCRFPLSRKSLSLTACGCRQRSVPLPFLSASKEVFLIVPAFPGEEAE